MKNNNDLIIAPSRNGILNPVNEYKHRKMADSLDSLVLPNSSQNSSKPVITDFDYNSIVRLSNNVKLSLMDDDYGNVDPVKVCRKISEWGGVLVPVIWREFRNLESSVHIYKRNTGRSFVYLNLDALEPDFLFLALRELGRLLTVESMRKDDGEWFSRLFALNIIMNEQDAKDNYYKIMDGSIRNNDYEIINCLMRVAKERKVSPLLILWRLNEFALRCNRKPLDVEGLLIKCLDEFNSCCVRMSAELFEYVVIDDEPLNSYHYKSVVDHLGSDFLNILNESCSSSNVDERRALECGVTNVYENIFNHFSEY